MGRFVSIIVDTKFDKFRDVETFADRVRRLREQASLSLADVASRTGKSVQWVSAIETGRLQEPGIFAGVKLARALGVSAEDLAFGPETAKAPSPTINLAEERLARAEAAVKLMPDLMRQVAAQGEKIAELLARLPPAEAAQPKSKGRRG